MPKIITSCLLNQAGVVNGCSTNAFGPISIYNQKYPKNLESFLGELKIPLERMVIMRQEHSDFIKEVSEQEAGSGKNSATYLQGVDGIFTCAKNVFLAIHTADCVPILIHDPKNKIVAAVHAGWQGTVKLIGQKMVERLAADCNSKPEDLICYLGPAIGPCCYTNNQNQERLRLFRQTFSRVANVIQEKGDDFTIDLRNVNLWQLKQAGVLEKNIEISELCTACRRDLFPSHRREGKKRKSNVLTVIGIRA